MKKLIALIVLSTIVHTLPATPTAAAGSSAAAVNRMEFWEDRINSAIPIRNSVYNSLNPGMASLTVTEWTETERRKVESVLAAAAPLVDTWNLLICGILRHLQGDSSAGAFLLNALASAENDPGTTWLLFTEFNRYRFQIFADRALLQLEKQMFMAGGVTAPIISRQLMHYGFVNKLAGDAVTADFFFSWAHRFNRHETASFLQRAALAFPRHPDAVTRSLAGALKVLAESWTAQLHLFRFLHQFIRTFLILYVVFISLALAIKYLARSLHRISHLYPDQVSPRLRSFLTIAIAVSFFSFGMIPVLWLLYFLFWKYLNRIERILCSVAVILILASPFDSAVGSRLQNAEDRNGPLFQLGRSLYQGTGTPDKSFIESDRTGTGYGKSLPEAIDILSKLKNGEMWSAQMKLDNLTGRQGISEPFLTNLKGISFFFRGAVDSAAQEFRKVLQSNPSDPSAQFNLARCHIALNDATGGMDLLKKAADDNPEVINSFIQQNDSHFSDNWPRLRQVLFPDYSPVTFWTRIFPEVTGDSAGWRLNWGVSFLGFPPVLSFILFLVLTAALFVTGRVSHGNRQLRRLFECKYCGRILCRRCTSGILCSFCAAATKDSGGTRKQEQVRERLIRTSKEWMEIRNGILETAVPGSGSLLGPDPHYLQTFIALLASCLVYTYWFVVVGGSIMQWMTLTERVVLIVPPCIFHIVFMIGNVPAIIRRGSTIAELSTPGKDAQ